MLVPIVIIGWWTGAPGASRSMAAAAAIVGVAYVAFRLSATGTWEVFEQDVGLASPSWTVHRRGSVWRRFRIGCTRTTAASTIANVLFAEPTRGVFRIVHAAVDDSLEPWHVVHLFSSVVLTAVIAWWGLRSLKMRDSKSVVARITTFCCDGRRRARVGPFELQLFPRPPRRHGRRFLCRRRLLCRRARRPVSRGGRASCSPRSRLS